MRTELPEGLPLVCPRCRRRDDSGWHMHTLAVVETFALDGDRVREGVLACVSCAARYPIIDGVPLVMTELAGYLHSELPALLEGALTPSAEALIVESLDGKEPFAQLIEHLSIYLDAHWGDHLAPPPADGDGGFAMAAVVDKLRARAASPVAYAVEIGCGAGRAAAELARGARRVIALDSSIGVLRRTRRLLAGEAVGFARRTSSRHAALATVSAGELSSPTIDLVCADAHDPPLVPGHYDRVVALNVLDSVRAPSTVLAVLDRLCAPGGELILSCPFSGPSGFDGPDPDRQLLARLRDGKQLDASYHIEDEDELTWTLRRDNRCKVNYRTLYVRARKAG